MDNYSVTKVSSVYHSLTQDDDVQWKRHADPDEIAETLAPPAAPGPIGRYLLIAATAGLIVCAATKFTFLWLFIGLSVGIMAEMMNYWEHLQARDDYHRALARWKAAYFCGRHAIVFFVGERRTYSPQQFAALVQANGARADDPAPVLVEPAAAPPGVWAAARR
jgi:hypothetical protein